MIVEAYYALGVLFGAGFVFYAVGVRAVEPYDNSSDSYSNGEQK